MAAASKKRITLAELKKRAGKGDLTEAEFRAYFELDEEKSKAFAPALRLNYARVDTGGKQFSTEETEELYEKAAAKRKAKLARSRRKRMAARGRRGTRRAAALVKVLAEGDSWFNLPDFISWLPEDIIDVLERTHNVVSVAKWRDTMENMVAQKQYVQKLESGNFRHFLFSGGGNDVLGSIKTFVKPCTPDDDDPANAPNYVKPSFATKVRGIIRQYETVADDTRRAEPRAVLYVHGYANAIPVDGGEYLGRPLAALGFNPSGLLAAAVVAHMVGMFNTALKNFAASRANIVYVDLRPKIKTDDDWNKDEIHPSALGAKKGAGAFAAAIAANPPVS
jgi:lysophospholipase L1-like esterase